MIIQMTGTAEVTSSSNTYAAIDCTLQVNNDNPLWAVDIDATSEITTIIVTAVQSWQQGIKLMVTIDGEDVTNALVGGLTISRRKNSIATFSFQLNDSAFSPLINTHIAADKEVVITSLVNGAEVKLFTGLTEDINVSWTGDFTIQVSGSDYGKKLRDTRTTLISIQDNASSKYRGDLIKYIALQSPISGLNTDIVKGSYTKIDHSFEDQALLDMITKELEIDGMKWEFNEDGGLLVGYDDIKSDTTLYPTPDWAYRENRFFYVNFFGTDSEIINDVKILGTMYEHQIEVANPEDSPSGQYISPTDNQLAYFSNSWSQDEAINWNASNNNFTLESDTGTGNIGGGGASSYQNPPGPSITWYHFDINWSGSNYSVTGIDYTSSGNIIVNSVHHRAGSSYARVVIKRTGVMVSGWYQEGSGSVNIGIRGKIKSTQSAAGGPGNTSAIFDGEEDNTPTYEYEYTQVAAHVTDETSIATYGRRKPNTEGTIEFPLAENTNQCKAIGRKIIKDSHRYISQPSFEIPFNPLMKVGHTIQINDSKIGYNGRWYIEQVNHNLSQAYGRTTVGCVYYA